MSQPLLVSPSPHAKGQGTIESIMYDVVIAMIPAIAASFYFFGIGALKVIAISVISCVLFEYLIQRFLLKGPQSITDGSAVITGVLLAFNLPSNLPIWIIIIGSLVAIGIGKMAFGGLGKNPFNPALVGRVFLFISFPVEMTSWPKPILSRTMFSIPDTVTAATPLGILGEGLSKSGVEATTVPELMSKMPTHLDLFLGNVGGSLGEVSALALLLGGTYMIFKKVITWHIPVSFLGTVAIFTATLWMLNPARYADPLFHLLSGGVMLGAIFMATDMVTSPMSRSGMLLFGFGCGVLTVVIRVFGAAPEGVSFAILIMNSVVPLINIRFKPKRFGKGRAYVK